MASDATPNWLQPHLPTLQAAAALFHPLVEVTVHDLRRERVVAVWNPSAGRRAGDASPAGLLPEDPDGYGVVGPVARTLADGRTVTSVRAVLRNAKGAARGLLCLEVDRTPLDGVVDLLVRFAAPSDDRGAEPAGRGWREEILLVVEEECRSRHFRRDRLTRSQRLELVRVLDGRGLFATRNAPNHAAAALFASRTTIYALLKEART